MARPLSKAEWMQRGDRGNWSYEQYVKWFNKNVVPRATARQKAIENSPQAIADREAESILAPLIKKQEERAARTSENLGGIYGALAREQAQIAPAISETYRQAATDTGAFAAGYSNTMRELLGTSAEEANQLLAAQGSPQKVESGAGAADVLYGLQGSIPGQALTREGAGFTAAAQFLPGTARTLGAQSQASALQAGQDAIEELRAKHPELARQILDSILDRGLQKRNLDIQESYLNNTLRKTGAEITGFDPVTGEPTADTTAATRAATAKAKGNRAAAIAKRNDATVEALSGATDWVESQLKPGVQAVETGRVPIRIGTQSMPGLGSVPIYATADGKGTTDPKKALTKPVYEQQPLPRAEYMKLKRQLVGRLRRELKRFGYQTRHFDEMAADILDDYYSFAEQHPATPGSRRGTSQPNKPDRRGGR